jgi:hypothetical protein
MVESRSGGDAVWEIDNLDVRPFVGLKNHNPRQSAQ